jgi:hypothetical protein
VATTDYDFSLTRSKIIESAFRKVGALTLGETLGADMALQGSENLNLMVKEWQNQHIYLWTQQILTEVFAIADNNEVLSLDPAVLYVEKPMRRDGTQDTPLTLRPFSEYQDLTNKSETGTPTTVYIDYKANPVMYVWPTPIAETTIVYLATVKAKDWDSASETGEFPQRFYLALIYGLAAILIDEYPLPISEKRALKAEAANYLLRAKASDRDRAPITHVRGAFR